MRKSPREVAMGLATQAEQLPKLRDKLLAVVDEINSVLNDGRARGVGRGPRKFKGRKNPARTRKKKQRGAKFIDGMPPDAVAVKGVHENYRYSPATGSVMSFTKNGKVRLLVTPRKGGSWTVKNSRGERLFLTRNRLREAGFQVAL